MDEAEDGRVSIRQMPNPSLASGARCSASAPSPPPSLAHSLATGACCFPSGESDQRDLGGGLAGGTKLVGLPDQMVAW